MYHTSDMFEMMYIHMQWKLSYFILHKSMVHNYATILKQTAKFHYF